MNYENSLNGKSLTKIWPVGQPWLGGGVTAGMQSVFIGPLDNIARLKPNPIYWGKGNIKKTK